MIFLGNKVFTCITIIILTSILNGLARDRIHTNNENIGPTGTSTVPNLVIVKFKKSLGGSLFKTQSGIASVDGLLQQNNVYALERFIKNTVRLKKKRTSTDIENIYYAHYRGDASPEEVAAALSQDPQIIYAVPKRLHQLYVEPDDSLYSQQRYPEMVQLPEAWDIVKGEQGDVVVAIVDGGTDIGHTDLAANLWQNPGEIPGNGIDDDNNGYIDDVHGWNFTTNQGDPTGFDDTPENYKHGTHTVGIVSAVTDNRIGVAGASWNARIMAINAASSSTDNAIEYGYEGVVYAINAGVDIISLSWGSLGNPMPFEQDIINYAADNDVVVVAAAGNDYTYADNNYPSSYKNVLSIAALDNSGRKADFSNYGRFVDICAPGVGLLSTTPGNKYERISGTSMSTPLVAGVIALVKTHHPDWTNFQAAEQVRISAVNIDGQNPEYATFLGKGRVDAFKALIDSLPSIRLADVTFLDQNQDGIVKPGEQVKIFLTMKNFLAPVSNVSLSLSENSYYAELVQSTVSISALGTLEEAQISQPFELVIGNDAPFNHQIDFVLTITSGNYKDREDFSLNVWPSFRNLEINHIATSITNVGRIGFGNISSSQQGIGLKFQKGPNLLFEGAIIAGTGPDRISSASRGDMIGGNIVYDDDFYIAEDGDLLISEPGFFSDQESVGGFEDSRAENPLPIHIKQETFALNKEPFQDFILFRYKVTNKAGQPLSNFHFGIFFDWDIDAANYTTNMIGFDPVERLGYAFDDGGEPDIYTGISLITDGDISYRAIYNNNEETANPSWGLYDGFTNEEKWQAISGGIQFTAAGPADVSHIIASGPHDIAANGELVLGFALLAGHNLEELQQTADLAKATWVQFFITGLPADKEFLTPTVFALEPNFPNPFNVSTRISYQIARQTNVSLTIHNVLGQKVRTLVQDRNPAGYYTESWDGRDDNGQVQPSGLYLYRLQTDHFTKVRKMSLLK